MFDVPLGEPRPRADRFAGCLLGLTVGDAVGAPYEGLTHADIFFQFGSPEMLVTNPSGDPLHYTDDTEMMIGVAETLAECGRIDEPRLCRAFAENYHPERGYGQGARRIIEAMAAGGDWRTLAATLLPGGSFGNGAAMRIAPVGLVFADAPEELWEQARLSALPTHTHPLGIEGAQLLAFAVAWALRATAFDRKRLWRDLLNRAATEEFRWHLGVAAKLKPGDSLAGLGSTLHAHRSVVTAIACFAATPGDFEMAISRAIGLGDDTDTVAAMAGALVGAFAGVGAIPAGLLEKLEDGPVKGRSHITGLAAKLSSRQPGEHQ
ncbi:MAG: ADP-ribosylglycohydrolase family protein [Planctomycetes bacterium]|nr:ADP-ribosylglycohydrolase family protein [Planctomycetota bacterium]